MPLKSKASATAPTAERLHAPTHFAFPAGGTKGDRLWRLKAKQKTKAINMPVTPIMPVIPIIPITPASEPENANAVAGPVKAKIPLWRLQ